MREDRAESPLVNAAEEAMAESQERHLFNLVIDRAWEENDTGEGMSFFWNDGMPYVLIENERIPCLTIVHGHDGTEVSVVTVFDKDLKTVHAAIGRLLATEEGA